MASTGSPIVETLVSSLVKQAPNHGIQDFVNKLLERERKPGTDVPRGVVAGLVAGLAGTVAKALTEQIFPITAPDPNKQRVINVGDQELHVSVDTREWAIGVVVGGLYGAAAELAPEVTVGNGLGLGSALYGLNNAGDAMTHDKVSVAPREENESHELLSDLVYGLVTEFVRTNLRARLN